MEIENLKNTKSSTHFLDGPISLASVLYSPPPVLPESAGLIWTHLESRYVTYRHMRGPLESAGVRQS